MHLEELYRKSHKLVLYIGLRDELCPSMFGNLVRKAAFSIHNILLHIDNIQSSILKILNSERGRMVFYKPSWSSVQLAERPKAERNVVDPNFITYVPARNLLPMCLFSMPLFQRSALGLFMLFLSPNMFSNRIFLFWHLLERLWPSGSYSYFLCLDYWFSLW